MRLHTLNTHRSYPHILSSQGESWGEVNKQSLTYREKKKKKASTSILNKNSHSPAVWALQYLVLSWVTKPSDQGKLENYVALVDVQPTGVGRMGHKGSPDNTVGRMPMQEHLLLNNRKSSPGSSAVTHMLHKRWSLYPGMAYLSPEQAQAVRSLLA